MKKLIGLILIMLPVLVVAQDYEMWETTYLKPKSGHYKQLMEKLADHNQKYHHEGAKSAYVFFVTNGPRTGQLAWVMGPCTFTDLDERAGDDDHFIDWFDNVMGHCEDDDRGTEYWVQNKDISHIPETQEGVLPIQRIRRFEVADTGLFMKMQKQLSEFAAKTPDRKDRPRVLYRRQFVNSDNWNWAMVSSFKNWAELDKELTNMTEAFEKVHGEGSWATFLEMANKAVTARSDEWRIAMDDLHGPQPEVNKN